MTKAVNAAADAAVEVKVSIVICGYNQAQYVKQAIDSALSQTHRHLEVIVVDNGSTDGSREVLRKYQGDPRIRLLLHLDNQPITMRLNEAIAQASGEYISILYADDYYLPRKIERQLEAFSKLPSDYGVVYSPCYREDAITGRRWIDATLKRSGDVLQDLLVLHFSEGFINPISPLLRRECFASYPFDQDVFVEGESIFLRIAMTYRFHYLDETLTVMREHSTNMGKTIKKNATTALLMFEKLARDPRFPPALLADLSTLRATFIGNCGWLGIRLAEDPAWARACLMTAFRSQPSQLLRVRPMAALLFSLLPLSVIRTFNRAMRRIRNHKETLAFKAEY